VERRAEIAGAVLLAGCGGGATVESAAADALIHHGVLMQPAI
jgi:hypothetical protein